MSDQIVIRINKKAVKANVLAFAQIVVSGALCAVAVADLIYWGPVLWSYLAGS